MFQVHGADWLASPLFSVALIIASFLFLAASIALKKRRSGQNFNIVTRAFGHRIVKTSDTWILFTGFLGLVALGAHFLAEFVLHLYDVTQIDKFTHGLSSMAITALVLHFNLSHRRRVYYPASIGVSWVAFLLWEAYEWIGKMVDPANAAETSLGDMAIDLWINSLGALSVCFIHDEFVHDSEEAKVRAS
jgi:hypothetical protein